MFTAHFRVNLACTLSQPTGSHSLPLPPNNATLEATMNIIAKDFTGLIKAILGLGCDDFASVVWVRQPVRINGMWRATVAL